MKKLWNRTRSRSRRQSETRPTTVKSSPSTEQLATPPVPALPRTSQSMQRAIGTEHDGRIRPVLVGVSRPGEFTSRPGTAGSLQHAVSLAADRSSLEFAKGHTRTKSPRYVDIFSASRTRSITSSAYNEEVAARNIDTKVTQRDQLREYVPSSKYQEEVALRNSYRSSSEAPRTSGDRNHRSWISSGTESGPSRGHTPHHSWSKSLQDTQQPPFSASESKAAPSHQPLPTVPDAQTPSPAAVSKIDEPSATMSGEPGVSTGQIGIVKARLAGYNLSRSEVSQPRPVDYLSTRSSSRMSATSSHTPVINLAHRTIMDLTGSDDESEQPQYPPARPVRSGAQATLPVQSAKQKQQQQQATSSERQLEQSRNETEPEIPDSRSAPVQVVTQIEPPKTLEPKPMQQASSFSMISTWASSPPAIEPAVPVPSRAQSAPRRDHVAAQLASATVANRLSTVNETETDVEDAGEFSQPTSPEPIVRSIKPAMVNGDVTSSVGALTATSTMSDTVADSPQTAPKHVYTSPESLQSVDFVNPSSSFGVRTRDFAVTPSKLNSRVEREANTKAKVSKTSAATNEADVAAPATNGDAAFDEDAFRRKQEQARAALIKLQQSLNEDYLPPPREQPAARPNRMNGVGQRKVPTSRTVGDPHGPVAPSSIFAKNREQGANGVDSYDSQEAPAPSILTHVTRPPLHSHASGSSSSTVRANMRGANRQPLSQSQPNVPPRARSADKKGKGKEREIDIALFNLQQAAADLGGPPRASSAHGRYGHSSLSDRRTGSAAGSYDRGANGYSYGPGQIDVKRPYTSAAQNGPIPPSPGDVSLSNFPTAPHQQQYQRDGGASPAPVIPQSPIRGYGQQASDHITERDVATERTMKRRGSTTSQASQMTSTSQYSIPFHMIPERGSSMRDIIVREDDGE